MDEILLQKEEISQEENDENPFSTEQKLEFIPTVK